jgi:hypothetical protein
MTKEAIARGISGVVFGLMLCFLVANWTATESAGVPGAESRESASTGQQEKTAEQVYKNIQVLKGIPSSQLKPAMTFIAGSLGVSCEHCHTNPWASDIKPAKLIARRHILMTQSINNENFGGRMVVTCNTCHQGQPQPPSVPAVAQAAWLKFNGKAESVAPTGSLPTVDQVFDKYVQAVGGKVAVERLKTQVLKGSMVSNNAITKPVPLSFEIYEAPNKILSIINTPKGIAYEGFNGTVGWISDPRERREMTAEELAEFMLDAELYKVIKLKEPYTQKTVIGRERIGDREAYVVEVTPADGKPEKLLFDTQTGLLIRRRVELKTVLGIITEETDFEDYRAVGGVRLPFTIRLSKLDGGLIRKFTEIKHNTPIDDAMFNIPIAK